MERLVHAMGGLPGNVDLAVLKAKRAALKEFESAFLSGNPSDQAVLASLFSESCDSKLSSLGFGTSVKPYLLPVLSVIPLSLVDVRALDGGCPNRIPPGKLSFSAYAAHVVSSALDRLGGKAVVEVDDAFLSVLWIVPPLSSISSPLEMTEVVWWSYMLQVGLLSDPSRMIAHKVYNGGGKSLCELYVQACRHGLNPHSSTSGVGILLACAPKFTLAWMAVAIFQMSILDFSGAQDSLSKVLELEPDDVEGRRLMVVCLTKLSPSKVFTVVSNWVLWINRHAVVPSLVDRVSIGMAFLSCGEAGLAKAWFLMADGEPDLPAMSVAQWVDWGWKMIASELKQALRSPLEFESGNR